jgi:hypothetical protein
MLSGHALLSMMVWIAGVGPWWAAKRAGSFYQAGMVGLTLSQQRRTQNTRSQNRVYTQTWASCHAHLFASPDLPQLSSSPDLPPHALIQRDDGGYYLLPLLLRLSGGYCLLHTHSILERKRCMYKAQMSTYV